MMKKMLDEIGKSYPLTVKENGNFAAAKVGPMKFTILSYEAKGLGKVSVMTGKAMGGLMKMNTLIVNPFDRDMPLFSYDRIHAMGNDTLLLELYDTRLDRSAEYPELTKIVESYNDLPGVPAESRWYDSIRLSQSVKKKNKKKGTPRCDAFAMDYVAAYLKLAQAAPACDREAKKKAAAVYTEGLLSNGGPSTDQFVKAYGKEYTEKLFREVLFGTGE